MPRQFRLTDTHYIDDRLLEAGTVIGEGTTVPFLYPDGTPRPPSLDMEGLSPEAEAEVAAVKAKAQWGMQPLDGLPLTMEGKPPAAKGAA